MTPRRTGRTLGGPVFGIILISACTLIARLRFLAGRLGAACGSARFQKTPPWGGRDPLGNLFLRPGLRARWHGSLGRDAGIGRHELDGRAISDLYISPCNRPCHGVRLSHVPASAFIARLGAFPRRYRGGYRKRIIPGCCSGTGHGTNTALRDGQPFPRRGS